MKQFRDSSKSTHPHPLSRQEALRCIPVINSSVEYTVMESGFIRIEFPLRLNPLMNSIFQRFGKQVQQPTKKLELDELGSSVWQLIDGKQTTKTIICRFAERHTLSLEESEQSVTLFLTELGKRGIIALA